MLWRRGELMRNFISLPMIEPRHAQSTDLPYEISRVALLWDLNLTDPTAFLNGALRSIYTARS